MANNVKPAVLNNLTYPVSSFIGREHDIAEVKKSLHKYRLVTLTGPGGCGKTRLALRTASDFAALYEHGVWLVEFASLNDPALIPQTVAAVFDIRERPGAELSQSVIEYISKNRFLLVFDNCEHLITDIANFVELLLRKCPHLSILATSREGLGVPGEALWVVPPLTLPIPQPWTDPTSAQQIVETYSKSESVQLFMARVSAFLPEFTLTVENGVWVAEICRRLDGMPLAIELAAARARTLSVKQICEHLDDRFNLLTAGRRTSPARQRTLAATLDWSYALLTDPERRVLQRLAVFSGGATLEAAEAVCKCECVKPVEVMDVLSHLVDKSLVLVDQNIFEPRYRLLETIRQYARGKLVAQGCEDDCKDCHLDYFVHWAEMTALTIEGQDQLIGLNRFEIEHDNLRAALEWACTNKDRAKAGLRLAVACGPFWRIHCYVSEGRRHFSRALTPKHVQDQSSTHASALMHFANLAYLQADYPAEQALIEEAIHIWRKLGQDGRLGLAYSLELYGEIKTAEGENISALRIFNEAIEIFGQMNDKNGIGLILMQLGWTAIRMGDYPQAEMHLRDFLVLAQETENKTSLNYAYSGLGEVALRKGEVSRAKSLLENGLSLSRERGDRWAEATILGSLGWAALRSHNFDLTRNLLGRSLSIRMEIGDKGGMAWCLEKLAETTVLEGDYQKAVKIFGFAASLRNPIRAVIDPVDQPIYERLLSNLQSRLDTNIYLACWEEGQAMSLKDVISCALAEPALPITSRLLSDKEKYQGLSKRERETAVFIAQGKTNREISLLMTIGEKTVETYVTRILNKLGFNSRVQIATWAVEKGLTSFQKK